MPQATRCVDQPLSVRACGDVNWGTANRRGRAGKVRLAQPPRLTHTARIEFQWKDQGWGNRKGSVEVMVDGGGDGRGLVIARLGKAPCRAGGRLTQ